ncbi:M20/M25/M40 family metallo-hydrolase [Paraglaciecola sp. 2405UD69-4]|uniref:M20/M25/M40 family metallo-hydrolase n=1 Tax=Paraglaciecola sp. 2405UD69-4 TaxID=3391836 RepID=UPI0039C900B5
MKFTILALTLVTGLLQQSSFAKPLIEQQIVERINQGLQQSTDTLQQVVNINSGTLNFEGVKEVADVFIAQFDAIGFDTQWVDGSEFNRAGHLVASYGTKGPKILMIGHLDTVFAKSDDFQRYQTLDNGFVAGPGIIDMKGGDVIILSALKALKGLNLLENVSVRVVMTGDEESSGRPLSLSKKAIIDAAKWADIALGFENADSNIKTAVVARRGSVGWQLNVEGRAAHSSQIFSEKVGYGAIFETARILNEFRENLVGVGNLSFNPGIIVGGTQINVQPQNATAGAFGKSNVVAKEVSVRGGIRALSLQELTDAQKVMQEIVAENLAHTSARLTFSEGYPPMSPTDNNYKLLSMYSDISESLGYGKVSPVNPRNAGAADISFAADHVDMAMDGLGLMGAGAHTKGEVADMSSFAKNMHKAAILIYRIGESELD